MEILSEEKNDLLLEKEKRIVNKTEECVEKNEKNMDKNKILKINNFCICVFAFLTGADFAVIIPTLWDRLNIDYNASGIYMGFVMSSYSLTGVLSGLLMGKLSDKSKRIKAFFLFSICFCILGHLFYFIGINKYFILFARAITGICIGASTVALAFIAKTTSQKERTSVLSIVMASRQIGLMFGPAFNIALRKLNFNLFNDTFIVDRKSAPGLFMAILWTFYLFIFFFLFKEINDCFKEKIQTIFKTKRK